MSTRYLSPLLSNVRRSISLAAVLGGLISVLQLENAAIETDTTSELKFRVFAVGWGADGELGVLGPGGLRTKLVRFLAIDANVDLGSGVAKASKRSCSLSSIDVEVMFRIVNLCSAMAVAKIVPRSSTSAVGQGIEAACVLSFNGRSHWFVRIGKCNGGYSEELVF